LTQDIQIVRYINVKKKKEVHGYLLLEKFTEEPRLEGLVDLQPTCSLNQLLIRQKVMLSFHRLIVVALD
jgi:hypothetical protein